MSPSPIQSNKCIFSPFADALISHLLWFKSSKSELYPQFRFREDDVTIRRYGLMSCLYYCVGPNITIKQQQQANKLGFVLQNQSMSWKEDCLQLVDNMVQHIRRTFFFFLE